jgi:hypothetical protein
VLQNLAGVESLGCHHSGADLAQADSVTPT